MSEYFFKRQSMCFSLKNSANMILLEQQRILPAIFFEMLNTSLTVSHHPYFPRPIILFSLPLGAPRLQ